MVTDATRMLARGALLVAALFGLEGCGTLYLAQAVRGQLALLAARQPIGRLIDDPRTSAGLRQKLVAVRDVRTFAVSALALPDNASYRSYADIGRPYVVWNVVATPEFSVDPLRWCFPVAGCVAYRGYFHERSARSFALGLRVRGRDAFVAGVAAYSTLGRFADPILSTMIDYRDGDLAAVVFHELAHQVVYLPGDSEFNEAFAVTVEETGLARWLAARGRAAELAAWQARQERQAALLSLFARGRARLRALYAGPLPEGPMRERKQELLAGIAREVREFELRSAIRSGYDEWLDQGLNNAHLAALGTYFDCVPGFRRLLAREGGDLPRFYAAVRKLARSAPAERRGLCSA